MVKIKISASDYSFKKTAWKVLKELLIWGLPQVVAFLVAQNPDFMSMSVGGLVSMGLKTVLDYLKHR